MQFPTPLFEARLLRRYKRFLADVELLEGPDAGQETTIHCPNPGSMMGLAKPGARIWVSKSPNLKRKLAYTYELEAVDGPGDPCLVGINTMHPNKLAEEAIRAGLVESLNGFDALLREQKYGEKSRIDILLTNESSDRKTFVEVKNVHLMRTAGHLEFPDSVTSRGAKHLGELSAMVAQGHRGILLFVAQWPGAETLGLARDIDPAYGRAMDAALAAGVEVLALDCTVTPQAITPTGMLRFVA
ncbi:MAG: DNA/RNA nuclease SfsA [Devosiaceae bacterium]|nr:DNA/RNA nuclease SfsA [Devosiaceae bacterium MH13]